MRVTFACLFAAGATLLSLPAFASEATTTRIETRPFYGAIVTLEAGVRVYRPLPPHNKVIINPGGKTPVNLGFEENRWTSHNYNYNEGPAAAPDVYRGGDGGIVGGFVRGGHKHRRPHHRGGAFGHGVRR